MKLRILLINPWMYDFAAVNLCSKPIGLLKVTSKNLVSAVKTLKKYGFAKNDIGVYLMYGLPGQDLDEVRVRYG